MKLSEAFDLPVGTVLRSTDGSKQTVEVRVVRLQVTVGPWIKCIMDGNRVAVAEFNEDHWEVVE